MKKNGIITKYMDYCLICGKSNVEYHHVIHGTANRKISDREGLVIPLCPSHHKNSSMSVHKNDEMRVLMHIIGELAWEKNYYKIKAGIGNDEARDEFRGLFGMNYL